MQMSNRASEGPAQVAHLGNGKRSTADADNSLAIEDKLWQAADKLRGSLDAASYKHVVLGLIFLKYISETFEHYRADLAQKLSNPASPDYVEDEQWRNELLESRDEYVSEGIFWVPEDARWSRLKDEAKSGGVGQNIDAAMTAIERENPSLRGVLPKDFARLAVDQRRFGGLIDLIGSIGLGQPTLGAPDDTDLLGRVYEYFLGRFAAAEGKGGGEFFTPRSVVKLLVEMIEPLHGRVYDPCCGTGGMFVQAHRFIDSHGGAHDEIAVYGQELNDTTWRLGQMNLALRHISADLGKRAADTFHTDLHPDLKADFVLANPPFNISDWDGEQLRGDRRWAYGTPPASNANYAWLQHIVSKLSPRGVAGVVLANGSMSSRTSGEGSIRQAMIEADLVDCMVALPSQLFYNTGIPACLWFLTRKKVPDTKRPWRDRRGEVLFIDARNMPGVMTTRVHRELTDEEIARIAATYHSWRGEAGTKPYVDVPGFCHSAKLDEIERHDWILTPGRYVGAEEVEAEQESNADKIERLSKDLRDAFTESERLQSQVLAALERLDV
ncbi:class I SAM-dependent DNA methyltransferase [Streptomyces sp. NPDC006132]|uniref:class I SAM-dependent DNA methyltransferase n=1 Tax=Streptomyces sp. NPDC006132 TaxID=3156732 RepID=UPI0033F84B38